MKVERVRIADRVRVEIEFESNYTAELPGGPQGYYVREAWVLERALDVRSRAPEAVQSFQCPACGAPYARSDAGACSHCGREVEDGRFDWSVTFVRLLGAETRPPALTGDVVEQGTGLPTVFDQTVRIDHATLERDDPSASAAHIERRLHDIYAALNAAWTARDLRTIRPHVSDSLYNYLAYWIDAYKNQGLRNVLKDMEISRMQVVKLVRDRHFDAITLRFWASGVDYTIGADSRLVSGNPKQKRVYSEYWTLIRGAKVRGAPRDVEKCPSCGAALDRVSMAGNCEYCGAHLTLGEFDWVLSKIEQDESYTG
jgi:ribosomal protein L37AE/L43A